MLTTLVACVDRLNCVSNKWKSWRWCFTRRSTSWTSYPICTGKDRCGQSSREPPAVAHEYASAEIQSPCRDTLLAWANERSPNRRFQPHSTRAFRRSKSRIASRWSLLSSLWRTWAHQLQCRWWSSESETYSSPLNSMSRQLIPPILLSRSPRLEGMQM